MILIHILSLIDNIGQVGGARIEQLDAPSLLIVQAFAIRELLSWILS